MSNLRLHLAPGITTVSTLGVESAQELLEAEVLAGGRSRELPTSGAERRFRFPLPGTPEQADGPLTGRPEGPRGAGTGWVVLDRWSPAPWSTLLVSRLTHPRSTSQAERRWNLLCHLREHGVGTPQPLAVGARGAGFVSRESFLVTREIGDGVGLADWLRDELRPTERRRGLQEMGATLARLFGADVELPNLGAKDVLIHAPGDEDPCGDGPAGLRPNRMPSVVIMDVSGGRMRSLTTPERAASQLMRLDDADLALDARERLAIARIALARYPRTFRRRALRLLIGSQ